MTLSEETKTPLASLTHKTAALLLLLKGKALLGRTKYIDAIALGEPLWAQ
jgi:hypothetical protein